jgi:hypothetical protein
MRDWEDLPNEAKQCEAGQEAVLQDFLDKHQTEQKLFSDLLRSDPKLWRWDGVNERIDSKTHFTDVSLCIQSATVLGKPEAFILARTERHEEALEKALRLAWFGDQMARMDGAMLHQLVALSVQTMGEKLVKTALLTTTDDRLLKQAQASLEKLGRPSSSLARVMQIEFLFAKNSPELPDEATMDYWGMNGWQRAVVIHTTLPNRTGAMYCDRVRRLIQGANQGWSELNGVVREIHDESASMRAERWELLVQSNLGGKILLERSWRNTSGVYTRACANEALHRMTIVTLALRRHELAHGHLPDTLQELVPAYLPEVPLDPFDDLPLRWDAAKKWLYSVGENGKDNHGAHEKPEMVGFANPDLVMPYWWLPQPEKKGP